MHAPGAPIFGIDLGTTNSLDATFDAASGTPRIIPARAIEAGSPDFDASRPRPSTGTSKSEEDFDGTAQARPDAAVQNLLPSIVRYAPGGRAYSKSHEPRRRAG